MLAGGAAVAGAAVLPSPALAAASVTARVQALRERWAAHRQDIRDTLFLDRPAGAGAPEAPALASLGDGFGALSILKDLEGVPYREQAHPAMQALVLDAAEALGGALRGCRELLEDYLGGDTADPEREAHLKAALRGIRLGLGDWKTSAGRVRSLEEGLLEIERETTPGALLRRIRRVVARVRRAEGVAARLAEHPETGLFEVQDPAIRAEVLAAAPLWAEGEVDPPPTGPAAASEPGRVRNGGLVALGAIVLGLGVVVSVFVVLTGLCTIACGSVWGILILLAGLGVGALAIWGGGKLIRKGAGAAPAEARGPEPLGPREVLAEHHVPVVGEETWVEAPVERRAGVLVLARATGLVRSPGRWMADADGNSVAAGEDALVPGAPLGAVVGRVGEDRFFLGAEGVVPEGPPGRLYLAVNRRPGGEGLKGHFVVRLGEYGTTLA